MDTSPGHNGSASAGIATLDNSGYTFSRLGLVPCDLDAPQSHVAESIAPATSAPAPIAPAASPSPIPSPVPVPPAVVHTNQPMSPRPAWRDAPAESPASDQPAARAAEEDFVRVTVKVPRALRDILRSCARNTHQYQYVLVIEALAEFLVQLPEDMQRQLLRDVNGETIRNCIKPDPKSDTASSAWKRIWKRCFNA